MTVKLGPYMTAKPVGTEPEVFTIHDRRDHIIGSIEWESRWRQYVVSPESEAIFSCDCLREMAAFCEQMTREKKKG